MFRKQVESLSDILPQMLRQEGLETPLLQLRAIKAWDNITGTFVARSTDEKFIKNQILFVKIKSPALRQELSMRRSILLKRINDEVGTKIISDLRIY